MGERWVEGVGQVGNSCGYPTLVHDVLPPSGRRCFYEVTGEPVRVWDALKR